jgi:hypothetical protein
MISSVGPNEIEFFVETNGSVHAERAFSAGTAFLSFVRQQLDDGYNAQIEVSYLGHGSFRARLMVFLRDPAVSTVAALTAVAMTGYGLLKEDQGDTAFVSEAAYACIESGASRCGIRVHESEKGKVSEFVVERSDMASISKIEDEIEAIEAPLRPPPAGFEYLRDSSGKFVRSDDGHYTIQPSKGDRHTALIKGTLQAENEDNGPWILETHDGFRVQLLFEQKFIGGWKLKPNIPVEVKGYLFLNQEGPSEPIFVVDWISPDVTFGYQENEENPGALEPRFTNVPVDDQIWVTGSLSTSGGQRILVQEDGSIGPVTGVYTGSLPRDDEKSLFLVSAVRGEHGGFADRGLAIHDWRGLSGPSDPNSW